MKSMSEISEDSPQEKNDAAWIATQKHPDVLEDGPIPQGLSEVPDLDFQPNQQSDHLFQIQPSLEFVNSSGTQDHISFLGYTFIVFGVLDFILGLLGTNITFFLGFFSYFTPILFFSIGSYFVSNKDTIPWFEVEKFPESNQAKAVYAGTVGGALFVLFLLVGFANIGNALDENLIGTWTNPVDELNLESNGDMSDSSGAFETWYIEDGNLILEEEEYYYVFKYTIVDDILFLAPFDVDDKLLEEDCIAYVEGSSGKTNSVYSDKLEAAEQDGKFPNWCQPE